MFSSRDYLLSRHPNINYRIRRSNVGAAPLLLSLVRLDMKYIECINVQTCRLMQN